MATDNQLAANRANAQLSTGPRSVEGKAISSQNARRHGLTARGFIVLPGQEDNFDALESGLRDLLSPDGVLQEALFTRILESAWTLHRCRLAEAELYSSSPNQSLDPMLDDQLDAKYARIRKYARQSENSMAKALRELGTLQTEAQFRHEFHPLSDEEIEQDDLYEQTPQALSPVCDFKKVLTATASIKTKLRKKTAQTRITAAHQAEAFALLDSFSKPPTMMPGTLRPQPDAKTAA